MVFPVWWTGSKLVLPSRCFCFAFSQGLFECWDADTSGSSPFLLHFWCNLGRVGAVCSGVSSALPIPLGFPSFPNCYQSPQWAGPGDPCEVNGQSPQLKAFSSSSSWGELGLNLGSISALLLLSAGVGGKPVADRGSEVSWTFLASHGKTILTTIQQTVLAYSTAMVQNAARGWIRPSC